MRSSSASSDRSASMRRQALGGDGINAGAGAVRLVLQPEQDADGINLESKLAGMPDETDAPDLVIAKQTPVRDGSVWQGIREPVPNWSIASAKLNCVGQPSTAFAAYPSFA
jgi:hypothetical protein